MQEFTFIDASNQQFSAILNNRRCTLRFRWNPTARRWFFDLAIDDDWVLMGRRLVLGTDLLGAYNFNLGSLFLVNANEKADNQPGYQELIQGTVILYHATPAELESYYAQIPA